MVTQTATPLSRTTELRELLVMNLSGLAHAARGASWTFLFADWRKIPIRLQRVPCDCIHQLFWMNRLLQHCLHTV